MLSSEKQLLWRLGAGLMGASLPLILFGSAVMGVILVIGILLALVATKGNSLRDTVVYLSQAKVTWLSMALLIIFFISAVFSVDVEKSMEKVLELGAMLFLALGFALALREMPGRHMEVMYQSLAISTTVVAFLVILDASVADVQLSGALYGEEALRPDRAHFMSAVLAVLSPFLWSWLLRRHKEGVLLAKWFAMPVIAASVIAVFMAGGFAGWAAMLFSMIMFLIYATKYHRLRWNWRYALPATCVVILGPLFYVMGQNLLEGPNATPTDLMTRVDIYIAGRLSLWQEALAHFGNNPLTGTGVNTFSLLPMRMESGNHPHNFLVQLLLETGILGTCVVVSVIGFMVRYFLRAAQTNLYGVAGLCSIFSFFIAALAQTSIFHPWWITFLIFIGIFAARTGYAVEKRLS